MHSIHAFTMVAMQGNPFSYFVRLDALQDIIYMEVSNWPWVYTFRPFLFSFIKTRAFRPCHSSRITTPRLYISAFFDSLTPCPDVCILVPYTPCVHDNMSITKNILLQHFFQKRYIVYHCELTMFQDYSWCCVCFDYQRTWTNQNL